MISNLGLMRGSDNTKAQLSVTEKKTREDSNSKQNLKVSSLIKVLEAFQQAISIPPSN
jgi:hypothetical protein